ncbi:MAG TPA: pteridine reductase [Steroidobacteraceae bacterium]|jgi:pteridine reductase|nr:pteridine reductase [Steroidobacteraceae bacterium]
MESTREDSELHDHVVLISGGARRIGAEIARTLHAAGANVLIHYRSSAAAAIALADELNKVRAHSAAIHAAHLLNAEAPDKLVAAALLEFGRLDILINNASSFYPTPVGQITQPQWDDLMGSNLKAPLFLSQAAAPSLRAQRGLILNMIDIHALRPLRAHLVYSVAKAGLAMLTRALARELGPEIRVNGIAPGPVLWPEGGMEDALKREIIDKTALKRHGTARDVARTALFLAKDAPYITGQIIAVDGGRSI